MKKSKKKQWSSDYQRGFTHGKAHGLDQLEEIVTFWRNQVVACEKKLRKQALDAGQEG